MTVSRIESMVDLRNQGQSLQQIGNRFGITRERVRQILNRAGYIGKPDAPPLKQNPLTAEEKRIRRLDYIRDWQKRNSAKVAAYRRSTRQRREKRDPAYKIRKNLSRRIAEVINGKIKAGRTEELLGCTAKELKSYLESLFKTGMTWDNYGVMGWHVDHVISCWRFDLTDPEEQKKCFHYTNLQPLWRDENLAKRDHWDREKAGKEMAPW